MLLRFDSSKINKIITSKRLGTLFHSIGELFKPSGKAVLVFSFIPLMIFPPVVDRPQVENLSTVQSDQIINSRQYGKGVIHYTENYIRKTSQEKLPIPDSYLDNPKNVQPKYIEGNECSRYLDLTNNDIALFKELQLQHVIVGFGPAAWYNIAKTRPADPTNPNDPAYDFTNLDRWVKTLTTKENNFTVVLQLWGTPTWESGATSPRPKAINSQYSDCTDQNKNIYYNADYNPQFSFAPYNIAPKDNKDYADFVEAVAKRYKDNKKVSAYSLWNEPNLVQFYQGGTIENFIDLNNQAYDRLKGLMTPQSSPWDSEILWGQNLDVWGGNLSGHFQNNGLGEPREFLANSKGNLKFDTFSVHAYGASNTVAPSEVKEDLGGKITASNMLNTLTILDQSKAYTGKPMIISETGFRSNIELNYNMNVINISEKTKAYFLYDELQKLSNDLNKLPANQAKRFKGIANNTLYNAWRWWSTGLVEMFDPKSNSVTFSNRLPAFNVFADWELSNGQLMFNSVAANYLPPLDSTIYYPGLKGYSVVKGDRYWYKQYQGSSWVNDTLSSIYKKSLNFSSVTPPTKDIDTAYFDLNGGYTVIKGDRYWYRSNDNSDWYSNTLTYAYGTGNWQTIGVPTSNIDVAYYDSKGGYTVVKGDRYWNRARGSVDWYTNTLVQAYGTRNWQEKGVPTKDIDSAYFDSTGGYTVIKGGSMWYRQSPDSDWIKSTITFEITIS